MSDNEDLAELYGEPKTTADILNTKAAKILELAQRLEELTKDTPASYTGIRAKVEARATLEQSRELGRVLEDLGKRLGE